MYNVRYDLIKKSKLKHEIFMYVPIYMYVYAHYKMCIIWIDKYVLYICICIIYVHMYTFVMWTNVNILANSNTSVPPNIEGDLKIYSDLKKKTFKPFFCSGKIF